MATQLCCIAADVVDDVNDNCYGNSRRADADRMAPPVVTWARKFNGAMKVHAILPPSGSNVPSRYQRRTLWFAD